MSIIWEVHEASLVYDNDEPQAIETGLGLIMFNSNQAASHNATDNDFGRTDERVEIRPVCHLEQHPAIGPFGSISIGEPRDAFGASLEEEQKFRAKQNETCE